MLKVWIIIGSAIILALTIVGIKILAEAFTPDIQAVWDEMNNNS